MGGGTPAGSQRRHKEVKIDNTTQSDKGFSVHRLLQSDAVKKTRLVQWGPPGKYDDTWGPEGYTNQPAIGGFQTAQGGGGGSLLPPATGQGAGVWALLNCVTTNWRGPLAHLRS